MGVLDMGEGSIYYGIFWTPPPSPLKYSFMLGMKLFCCFYLGKLEFCIMVEKLEFKMFSGVLDGGGGGGGGVNILWYNILTPPPPPQTKYSRKVFYNRIKCQFSFITQNM